MVKEIKLANNKGVALVDDEDYERLNEYKWNLAKPYYASTNIYINNERTMKRMHLLILDGIKGKEIDHIDGNGLNNQKNNLRLVNRSQNCMNRNKRKNCSSKYKGVSWDKNEKKWRVHICINKKIKYLGRFENEIKAANAYNKAAKELFNEYANLNEV